MSMFGQNDNESDDSKKGVEEEIEVGPEWSTTPDFERWIVIEGVKTTADQKLT